MTPTGSSRFMPPTSTTSITTSKDLYLQHSLAPGESRSFEGWLQVGPTGDLAPVVAAEIERSDEEAATLTGDRHLARGAVPNSVLVVEKEGVPYAWTLTPDGILRDGPAGGRLQPSMPRPRAIPTPRRRRWRCAGGEQRDDRLLRSRSPRNARLRGHRRRRHADRRAHRHYRGADARGRVPGRGHLFHRARGRGHGRGLAGPGRLRLHRRSRHRLPGRRRERAGDRDLGREPEVEVGWSSSPALPRRAGMPPTCTTMPTSSKGTTPPEYLARAELAAGLDLIFVSDHDFDRQPCRRSPRSRRRATCPSFRRSSSLPLGATSTPIRSISASRSSRHLHGHRGGDPCRGAAAGRGHDPGQPPVHPLRLPRESGGGQRPRRVRRDFDLLEMNGEDDARVFEPPNISGTRDTASSCPPDRTPTTSGPTIRAPRAPMSMSRGVATEAFVANGGWPRLCHPRAPDRSRDHVRLQLRVEPGTTRPCPST